MNPQTVFLIGKPGCGKGTQAKLLAERTGWQVVGSGKQFRAIAEEDTPVGRKVREENHHGILQPHWFAMYLYLKNLFALPEGKGVIFDGFNRRIEEAELNAASLEWLERPYSVVLIEISEEEAIKRASGRRETETRADDKHPQTRIEEYNLYTIKAIEVFRAKGVLLEVDGERTPEVIGEEIAEILGVA